MMERLRAWMGGRGPARRPAGSRIQAQVLSDIGCQRDLNEDSACCIHPVDMRLLRNKGVLAIVADGMGGHPAGEVASEIVTCTIAKTYYGSRYGAERALREAFAAANDAVLQISNLNEESKGMGATCTAVALLPDNAIFGHIGDTRLYQLRDGEFSQLTKDQTRVMKLVEEGLLTKEDARRHEDRNVVLEALGQRPSIDGAQWGAAFRTAIGDQFVLCSDGLHELVRDEEIREYVLQREPAVACGDLVALAKRRGGYDNITVIVLRVVTASNSPRTTSSDATSDATEEILNVATDH
jgi:serine/threonine protein phosphatase PrpC